MTNTTFLEAVNLKTTINYLQAVRDELDNAGTQSVILLTRRKHLSPPPLALTDSLQAVENNLIDQAKTLLENQISSLQTAFDNL